MTANRSRFFLIGDVVEGAVSSVLLSCDTGAVTAAADSCGGADIAAAVNAAAAVFDINAAAAIFDVSAGACVVVLSLALLLLTGLFKSHSDMKSRLISSIDFIYIF